MRTGAWMEGMSRMLGKTSSQEGQKVHVGFSTRMPACQKRLLTVCQ